MEELSSCYFCGAAVDSSVEPYPVVPEDVETTLDPGVEVWLCPSCHRKLDQIVGTVIQSVAESPDVDSVMDEDAGVDGETGTGPTPGGATDQPGGSDGAPGGETDAEDSPAAAWTDVDADAEAGSTGGTEDGPTGGPSSDTADGPTGGLSPGTEDGPTGSTDEETTRAGGTDPGEGPSVWESIRSDSTPPDDGPAADGPAGGSGTDEPPGDSVGDARTGGDPDSPDVDDGTVFGPDDATGDRSTDPDTSGDRSEEVPVEAYNRIVRLLRNRDFPVERAEIVDVATSAYELSTAECDRVLDAMVEREVLGQRGSQLVRVDD